MPGARDILPLGGDGVSTARGLLGCATRAKLGRRSRPREAARAAAGSSAKAAAARTLWDAEMLLLSVVRSVLVRSFRAILLAGSAGLAPAQPVGCGGSTRLCAHLPPGPSPRASAARGSANRGRALPNWRNPQGPSLTRGNARQRMTPALGQTARLPGARTEADRVGGRFRAYRLGDSARRGSRYSPVLAVGFASSSRGLRGRVAPGGVGSPERAIPEVISRRRVASLSRAHAAEVASCTVRSGRSGRRRRAPRLRARVRFYS